MATMLSPTRVTPGSFNSLQQQAGFSVDDAKAHEENEGGGQYKDEDVDEVNRKGLFVFSRKHINSEGGYGEHYFFFKVS